MQNAGFTQPVLTSHRSILMLEIAIVAQQVVKDKRQKANCCACFVARDCVERALPVISTWVSSYPAPKPQLPPAGRVWPHLASFTASSFTSTATASPRRFRVLPAQLSHHARISMPLGEEKGGRWAYLSHRSAHLGTNAHRPHS